MPEIALGHRDALGVESIKNWTNTYLKVSSAHTCFHCQAIKSTKETNLISHPLSFRPLQSVQKQTQETANQKLLPTMLLEALEDHSVSTHESSFVKPSTGKRERSFSAPSLVSLVFHLPRELSCLGDSSPTTPLDVGDVGADLVGSEESTTVSLIDGVMDDIDRIQRQLDEELMELLQTQARIAQFRISILESMLRTNQGTPPEEVGQLSRESRWSSTHQRTNIQSLPWSAEAFPTGSILSSPSSRSLPSSWSFKHAPRPKKSVRFRMTGNTTDVVLTSP